MGKAHSVLVGLVVQAAFGSMCMAQACSHTHDNHPTSNHGGGWYRTALVSNWNSPIVTNTEQAWQVVFKYTEKNPTCSNVVATASFSATRTDTVSVSGSITAGGSVEATANAIVGSVTLASETSATIGGGWSGANSITISGSSTFTLPKCRKTTYTLRILRKNATTDPVDTAEHRIVCKKNGAYWTNYCCFTTLEGDAIGHPEYEGGWSVPSFQPCDCGSVE